MPTSWIFQTFVIILPIFRDIVYICISIICINSNKWKLWIILTFKFIMQGVYIKEILFKSKSRGFRKGLREGLKKVWKIPHLLLTQTPKGKKSWSKIDFKGMFCFFLDLVPRLTHQIVEFSSLFFNPLTFLTNHLRGLNCNSFIRPHFMVNKNI